MGRTQQTARKANPGCAPLRKNLSTKGCVRNRRQLVLTTTSDSSISSSEVETDQEPQRHVEPIFCGLSLNQVKPASSSRRQDESRVVESSSMGGTT